ncbi:uncharacterized protein TNCV_938571 [Trichonephila clavipes]|nr:uncharacterized protein TNCV_938571 [Trichonephila clavipes]
MRKRATASALSRCLRIGPTVTRVSHGFPKLLFIWVHGSIFVNVCGDDTLCSSEGQGNFRLSRLGSMFGFLVGSFISDDPNMTWDPLYQILNKPLLLKIRYFESNVPVAAVAEWYRYRIVACLVTISSTVPLKTHRVGQRCTLNLWRAETSSRRCGVVVRRGGASSGVVHVT